VFISRFSRLNFSKITTITFCGILINVLGFAGAVGTPVPIGATYIYRLNFFSGFIVSAGIYWILCKMRPVMAPNLVGHWYGVEHAFQGGVGWVAGVWWEERIVEESNVEKEDILVVGRRD
jgi:hypothetical protein